MSDDLAREVDIKEQESVMGEAMEREMEARNQDNMGVLGNAGEAAAAAEAYAHAEEALKEDEKVANYAADDALRIDDAADKA